MIAAAARKLPLGTGRIRFKVSNSYSVPASRLWEAVTKCNHN